ncbi:hypothetical protein OHD62_31040 [Mesorhizobium sp. YC-39]|uniref:hypothetical protein n=1 Tax=unclassified Mesorhizobium TaxID=325217 RepID=UPI0021E8C847|nr:MULTISPECIES: hypothetical protein [unclassified Mesorhizobium]MCV3211102.1 hypothetical protein [Mesorhizobium sp. YC-2]MCV3232827.1 hypothetical protein [Mesorhizobium sp. YC-39]
MAKKPAAPSAYAGERRPHVREIPIEGMMLHLRTIIEQGRTKEFLKACQDSGFTTVKGQKGLVTFVRDFVNVGEGMQRTTTITGADAQKFVLATQRKTRKRDHCN